MEMIKQAIDVNVPVSVAYNQWTQFEEFPCFMEGVEEVRQLDSTRLHWVVQVDGRQKEWQTRILEQIPDQLIAWESEAGDFTSGRVTFDRLDNETTRIKVELQYKAADAVEQMGEEMFGLATRQVARDLKRFKAFIEQRQEATGAWRGTIQQGEEVNANL